MSSEINKLADNPCEKCIVNSMCKDDCQDLIDFIVVQMEEYDIAKSLLKAMMAGNLKNQTIAFGFSNAEIVIEIKNGFITKRNNK